MKITCRGLGKVGTVYRLKHLTLYEVDLPAADSVVMRWLICGR